MPITGERAIIDGYRAEYGCSVGTAYNHRKADHPRWVAYAEKHSSRRELPDDDSDEMPESALAMVEYEETGDIYEDEVRFWHKVKAAAVEIKNPKEVALASDRLNKALENRRKDRSSAGKVGRESGALVAWSVITPMLARAWTLQANSIIAEVLLALREAAPDRRGSDLQALAERCRDALMGRWSVEEFKRAAEG